MVEVQVREHDAGDRAEVELLGDRRVELELERAHLRPFVVGRRVGDRSRVQAGVDQDPLAVRLDQVGGASDSQPALGSSPCR